MATPITTLELRRVKIPHSPLIESIERELGRSLTHEYRHYLAGEPVHCGDILELFHQGGWIRGRYEWTTESDQAPTFESDGMVLRLDPTKLLRWPD
jgi:hypothetical protein